MVDPQGSYRRYRTRVVIGRWLSMLACGIVAAFLAFLIWPWATPLLESAASHLGSLSVPVLLILVSTTVATVSWFIGRDRWLAALGLRHPFAYPGLWVAFAASGLVISLITKSSPSSDFANSTMFNLRQIRGLPRFLMFAMPVLVVPIIIDLISRSRMSDKSRGRDSPNSKDDFDSLKDWIVDDREVTHPLLDRYGHNRVASRIASRLTVPEAPTIAVVGPLGSGKSTIKRLTCHQLEDSSGIEVIEVSLWPVETPEAAVARILSALVDALGKHTNTLAITGIPREYIRTIEHTAGNWPALGHLLRGTTSPDSLLCKLEGITSAIDVRFVLWIEDLERFAGTMSLTHEVACARESERLGPVRALLYQLDCCARISVLISDTSLGTRFDLDKLARFVEHPPRITLRAVAHDLDTLRSSCLSGYPYSIIDPVGAEERGQYEKSESYDLFMQLSDSLLEGSASLQGSIVVLLKTPRQLKSALRLTLETWENLAGEIDFDDVLVATILRVARPAIFSFVDEQIDALRYGFESSFGPGSSDGKSHPIRLELEQLIASEPTARESKAVESLITRLFPNAFKEHTTREEYVQKPQGVSVHRHVDYWRRYTSGVLDPEDQADQKALRSIKAWKDEEESDLLDRLISDEHSDQIESFVGQFGRTDLLKLLKLIVDRVMTLQYPSQASEDVAPGVIPIWRMCHRLPPNEEHLAKLLRELLHQVVPVNLKLALDLEYYFTASGETVGALVNRDLATQVRDTLTDEFCATFLPSNLDGLANVLKNVSPYTVYWIVDGIRGGSRKPFGRWPELAVLLMKLVKKHPELGTAVIAPFITNSSHRFVPEKNDPNSPTNVRAWVSEVDETRAGEIFDVDELAKALAGQRIPENPTEQLDLQIEAAIRWSQEYLSNNRANENGRSSGGSV